MEPEEIYQEIHDEVVDNVSLGATSTSKVAEWRKIIYIVTNISLVLQGLWDIMITQLKSTADTVPTCNDAWWDREIRKFQYGHTLLLDSVTRKYYYAIEDIDSRIVTRVAIHQQSGLGIIKVAKDGPAPLDTDERSALDSYIRKVQPTGANITLISDAADLIRLDLIIYYDPIVPQGTVQADVEAAINTYLSSLSFNVGKTGTFYTTYLIDAIQTVTGVVDVTVTAISANQQGESILLDIERKYVPVAGYLDVHPDHALADTITYTPEI